MAKPFINKGPAKLFPNEEDHHGFTLRIGPATLEGRTEHDGSVTISDFDLKGNRPIPEPQLIFNDDGDQLPDAFVFDVGPVQATGELEFQVINDVVTSSTGNFIGSFGPANFSGTFTAALDQAGDIESITFEQASVSLRSGASYSLSDFLIAL